MLYCSKCATKNSKDSKFCRNCGLPIVIKYIEKAVNNNIKSDLDYKKENIKMQQESLKIQKKQLIEQKNNLIVWRSAFVVDQHHSQAIKKDLE